MCAQYPSAWTFTGSAFGDPALNKTWTLKDSGSCVWQDYSHTVKLGLDSTMQNFVLTLKSQGTQITYQLALSSWNCCGPNTLAVNGNPTAPSSVTLTGADCQCQAPFCSSCDFCASTTYPKAYQMAVSGFSD